MIIFIDNLAVVNSTKAEIRSGGLPKNAAGIWAEVRELARRVPGLEIHWIPSHGKKKASWRPPDGIDGSLARFLNDKADKEATHYAKLACGDVETQRLGHLEAERWAARVHLELERRSGEMITQNARYFKRRRRRARGVGGQMSESDDPDGGGPDEPDDRGDGPPGGGPPGGGPPGGGPPCLKLLAGVPRRLRRKHVRRARAFLDWQSDEDRTQDPPDGPTPLTPAIRRKKIPASAEVEPKKPRRAARETRTRWRPEGEGGADEGPPTKRHDLCPTGTFVRVDAVEASVGPKPKRGEKRAQWETDDDRRGRVALPWTKNDVVADGGGKGGDESSQAPKKACERTK